MTTAEAAGAVGGAPAPRTRTQGVALTVGAAVLSLVLIGAALLTHGAGAPAVVWALLAAASLAVRPVAVAVYRRSSRA